MAARILDQHGRPISSASEGEDLQSGMLDRLLRASPDGQGITIPAAMVTRLRAEQARRFTMSRVPSTPKNLQREASGEAVAKGAGLGRYGALSPQFLRQVREASPILQPIHSARHHQVRRMAVKWTGRKGQVGWRVVHKDHFMDRKIPEGMEPYIRAAEQVLERPSRYNASLADALIPLWEGLATINRPAIEILPSVLDRNVIAGFRQVDGAIIWPTLKFAEHWIRKNPTWESASGFDGAIAESAKLEVLSYLVGADLAGSEYCLVRDGVVEATYEPGVLIVAPMQTRDSVEWAGWPPSYVEQAIGGALAFARSFHYNDSQFTKGAMIEMFLAVVGDVDDEHIEAFRDQFRESSMGLERAHEIPILQMPDQGAVTPVPLKQTNRDMMFEEWMSLVLSLTCATYRADPSTINAKPWGGGGAPSLSEGNRHTEITLAKEEGLQGDLMHLADSILTPFVRLCHPDLKVVFEYGDTDVSKELQNIQLATAVFKTRNEARVEQGDEPIPPYWKAAELKKLSPEDRALYDANPWNYPTDPALFQAIQGQRQAEEARLAAQNDPYGGQMPPDDGFGQPPAEGDDGYGQPPAQFAPEGATPAADVPGAPGAALAPKPPQAPTAPMAKGTPRPRRPQPRQITVEILGGGGCDHG